MEALGSAERLLNILDDYSSKITGSRYTLKETPYTRRRMETEKASLQPLMEYRRKATVRGIFSTVFLSQLPWRR